MNEQLERAKDAALTGFREEGSGHLNCAQAVVRFSARVMGAEDDSVTLARYFGGGITGMGHICGALSGCALSLGLRDRHLGLSWPDGPAPDAEKLQDLIRAFEAEFGAPTCKGLVGYDISTKEGFDRFMADDKHDACATYVAWACDRLYDLLAVTD